MKKKLTCQDRILLDMNKLKIAILDDCADDIVSQLTKIIDAEFVPWSLAKVKKFYDGNKGLFLNGYDLLFIDASYEDSSVNFNALELLATLIEYDSEYKNMAYVLLGADVEKYRWDEYLGDKVARAKAMPHMVYTNKLEAIIKIVEARSKQIGIPVPWKKVDVYEVRPEILECFEQWRSFERETSHKLNNMCEVSKDVLDIEPITEAERELLEYLKKLTQFNMLYAHYCNNYLGVMNSIKRKCDRKKE